MTNDRLRLASLLAGVVLLSGVFGSVSAYSQSTSSCGVRADIVAHLDKKFGEQRNNMMLDADGNLVEMFSNLETGSWTLTVTKPDGPTCVMSDGESFVQEDRTENFKKGSSS